jgi:phage N-6-adenine-methyltransferase
MGMTHVSNTGAGTWRTPRPLGRALVAEHGCTLDAAADELNALCDIYFSEVEDGLRQKWFGVVWLNPPFSEIPLWLAKAEAEVKAGNCERVVMLLPCSPGTGWWTRAVLEHEVHLFNRRVKFEVPPGLDVKNSAPGFGTCLVIVQPDGLTGVTAMRDSLTGQVLHDFTEDRSSR